MGLQVSSQVHTSCKSHKFHVCIYTDDLQSTYVDLHWVAKCLKKTCSNLCKNMSTSIEVNASHRKWVAK